MAVISKILTSTLTAGATYVTFTDSDIPNSLIRVFADDPDLMYQTVSLTGNTLTLTYEAQASNKSIALDIVKQGLEVIDTLDSTDVSKALSANQGRILKTYIDNLPTPVYDLSKLDDVEITEITDGQVLAWDDDLQKFVNVDQSGGGSASWDYSTEEQIIGKWLDNSNVYKRSFVTTQAYNNVASNTWCAINEIDSSNIKYVIEASWLQVDTNYTPVVSVNYPVLASTNRSSFNNKLAVIQTRGAATSFPAGSIITIIYTKITE